MNILPISDLRQDAAKILKKLRDNKKTIIITQRGRAAGVMIGVEAYEKSEHDKEILWLLVIVSRPLILPVGLSKVTLCFKLSKEDIASISTVM